MILHRSSCRARRLFRAGVFDEPARQHCALRESVGRASRPRPPRTSHARHAVQRPHRCGRLRDRRRRSCSSSKLMLSSLDQCGCLDICRQSLDRCPLSGRAHQAPAVSTRLTSIAIPHALAFAPGSRFLYSDLRFRWLGDVIAAKTHMRFEDYLRLRMLEPRYLASTGAM